jgi:hypothetical protein
VLEEMALKHIFSELFIFSMFIFILLLLHTDFSPPHEMYGSPDQAAHYHTLGPQLWVSSMYDLAFG